MGYTLRAAGYEVETATNGREALDKVRQQPLDVILLDLMMPGVDGWQFLREWRADPTISGIPVIVVSAAYEAARRAELGTLVFLAKPVEPSMLMLEDALSTPRGNQIAST